MKVFLRIMLFSIPAVLYLLYMYLAAKKKVNEIEVDNYIKNSSEIKIVGIKVIKRKTKSYYSPWGFYTYPLNKETLLIKSTKDDNRFFIIEVYNNSQKHVVVDNGGEVLVRINNEEYKDILRGTEENPVPVLYFMNENGYGTDSSDYIKNVREYLTYCKKDRKN